MKLLLKVHGERTARNRRTPERSYQANASPRPHSNNHANANATASATAAASVPASVPADADHIRKSQRLTRNTLLLALLVLLVLFTAIVIVFVEFNRTQRRDQGAESEEPIFFGNTYDDGTFPNLGDGHLVIERVQWGSLELGTHRRVPLPHPIPYVLVAHVGVQSTPCRNLYRCSIKMRTLQDSARSEKNLPDIQSNFYVSDEGNIYVGRGWDWANTYANHTLAITFLGDYDRYQPSSRQLQAVQFLLAHAVANRKLDINYKLIAQKQTKSTRSPGINVIREISKWRHFHACNMLQAAKCGSELGMTVESWDIGQ